tara:strand:+ start:1893 stop:2120 length:228 start_codon:yes stop_codon:yes gene_type:complete
MTFQEAKEKIERNGRTYIHEGDVYVARIIPENRTDELKFTDKLKLGCVSDEECKAMSRDGKFKVHGFNSNAYTCL